MRKENHHIGIYPKNTDILFKLMNNKIIKKVLDVLFFPYYFFPYLYLNDRALPLRKLSLDLTFRCNQSCAMCGRAQLKKHKKEMSANELTLDDYKVIVDDLRSHNDNLIVQFTGGEPFVRRDIIDIIKLFKQVSRRLIILTNATLITEERLESLISIGVDILNISIDAIGEKHDVIRGERGAFAKAISVVKRINTLKNELGLKKPTINFSATISALNQYELENLYSFFRENKISGYFNHLIFYTKDELEDFIHNDIIADSFLLPEEITNIDIDNLVRTIVRIKNSINEDKLPIAFEPDLNKNEVNKYYTDDDFYLGGQCFYPWFAARIDPYGEVYPCMISKSMGNVKEQTISDIWNGEKYREFRNELRKNGVFPECRRCCVLRNWLWRKF